MKDEPIEKETLLFDKLKVDLSQPLKVKISNFEKVTGKTLIDPSYIVYVVECETYNSTVRRRYNDFLWLRNNLIKYYPGLYVPSIPSKSMLNDLIDSDFLYKRVKRLNYFFEHLEKQRILSHSIIVKEFLTEDNQVEFSRKKSNYENYAPESLRYIEYLNDDEAASANYKENEEKLLSVKRTMDSGQLILKELQSEYFKLQTDLKMIATRISGITNLYNQLYNHHKETQEFYEVKETKVYYYLHELHKKWEESYTQQERFFSENFENFYGFIKKQYEGFSEMVDLYNISKENYFAFEDELSKKKEKFYKMQNFERWDLSEEDFINKADFINDKEACFEKMLRTETTKMIDYRDKYLYLNIKTLKEYHKFQKYMGKFVSGHYANLALNNKQLLCTVFTLVQLINVNVQD